MRGRNPFGLVLVLAAVVSGGAGAASASGDEDGPIVVGSKNFSESRLLAEMFAQLLEQHGAATVERRFDLAGTQVCFEALRSGAIDLYPEYTGTGLVSILGEQAGGGSAEVLRRVRREFRARFDLVWLAPLGFENAYELAVPATLARDRGLRSISDLARGSPDLVAGLGYEFLERPDGLPALEAAYGLRFRETRGLQQALKIEAVADGSIDVLDVYSTDARVLLHDLVILDDDLGVFPPYEAAPLVRGDLLDRHPETARVLALLAGAIDEDTMRGWNARLQNEDLAVRDVAATALTELGLTSTPAAAPVGTSSFGLFDALRKRRVELGRRTLEHLGLTAAALGLGFLVALPLALFLERRRRWAEPVLRIFGTTQTIPSLALLAFLVPLAGIGTMPALLALWLYSIYPMLRNAYTGLRDAAPEAVESGRALGMTHRQILRHIRLPLAVPVILAGVRTSAVLTIGTATLAAFIGAGGLGAPIVTGLQLADPVRILAGALPAALLAIALDALLHRVEVRLTPRGLSRSAVADTLE